MTSKLTLSQPTLILLYGFPGAGKTFLARQLCEDMHAAHVQIDRIRYELFEEPRYDKQENEIVNHLAEYMAEEFLNAGLSVVFDTNVMRIAQRRVLRDLAKKNKAIPILIWLQIDLESSYERISKRDHRKTDDKYAMDYDRNAFKSFVNFMQKPVPNEDYVVVSGKHNYKTQYAAVMKKLYDIGLILSASAVDKMVKPGLVNLVPNSKLGRVDKTRRNIFIR